MLLPLLCASLCTGPKDAERMGVNRGASKNGLQGSSLASCALPVLSLPFTLDLPSAGIFLPACE